MRMGTEACIQPFLPQTADTGRLDLSLGRGRHIHKRNRRRQLGAVGESEESPSGNMAIPISTAQTHKKCLRGVGRLRATEMPDAVERQCVADILVPGADDGGLRVLKRTNVCR